MTHLKPTACLLLSILTFLFFVTIASAAIVTLPSGLNPGDQYRLGFVTSGQRNAASTNIADYNTFVTNAANAVPELAALNTQWFVIGSTSTVDARTNTGTTPSSAGGSLGGPIFLLNDTMLASSNDDLWDGSIATPLNFTEQMTTLTGGSSPSNRVWTGSNFSNGTIFRPLGSNLVNVGALNASNGHWIGSTSFLDENGNGHFYALSAPLTAVPTPSAMLLMGSGLVGLVGWRWWSAKKNG